MDKALPTKESPKKRWSKSVEKDGTTKRMEVRQIENGFLVTMNFYGQDNKGKYFDKTREYYSKENPLEEASEDVKNLNSLKEVFKVDNIFD
jgi:hypothetical protein